MEAFVIAESKICKLRAQYLTEKIHWSCEVEAIILKYDLTDADMAPILEFIERLCCHLSDQFPESEKLQLLCIFDVNDIRNADFCFSHNQFELLVKRYKNFLPAQDQQQLEANATDFIDKTKNAYNDLKYIVKASSGNTRN